MKINLQQDLHMHTVYSDGQSLAEEMVVSAIEKGFKRIAITDHAPLPYPTVYTMSVENHPKYLAELSRLKEKYLGQIELLIGMEFDYLSTDVEWVKKVISKGLDYKLGSIHDIYDEKLKKYRCIDAELEETQAVIRDIFKGDVKLFVAEYFRLLAGAARSGLFDTIGHFDLIKKFNKDDCLFDENESWYHELVYKCLDQIKQSRVALDLNTAGFGMPVGVQYPSEWIIKAALERGITFVSGSDAHTPEDIGQNFDKLPSLFASTSVE